MKNHWSYYCIPAICIVIFSTTALVTPVMGAMGPPLPNTDIPGHDIKDFTEIQGAQHCADTCEASPECRSATYIKPGASGFIGHCWLKNYRPAEWEKVANTDATSFVKDYYYYEGLHWPKIINLDGTLLTSTDETDYTPTARFPVGVYRTKNRLFDNSQGNTEQIDTIYPDVKGHFTYDYEDHSDLYYWQFITFKPIVPKGNGYLLHSPSINGGISQKDFTTPVAKPDGSLIYDMYTMKGDDSLITAQWKIIAPQMVLAKPLIDQRNVINTEGSAGQLKDLVQKSIPGLSADSSFGSSSKSGTTTISLSYPAFANNCPRYILFTLRPEGKLWDYLVQDSVWTFDNEFKTNGQVVNIKCKSGGTSGNSGIPDMTQCKEWTLEINNENNQINCDSESLTLATVYYNIDLKKIGKGDSSLKGGFLGFKGIGAGDIYYIGSDGQAIDSAGIAAQSWSNRAYADLLILGDCNRDGTISYADIGTMNEIKGQEGSFDAICDMDGNGKINEKDISLLTARLGQDGLKGDCNGDWKIDSSDAGYLKMLLVQETTTDVLPALCDMDGDGKLTYDDLDGLNKKLAAAGSSGWQKSSVQGDLVPAGNTSIPEGLDRMNLQAGEIQSPAGKEDVAMPEKGLSFVDMLFTLPETIISFVRNNPEEKTTIYYMPEQPPSGPGTGSVQVVMNPETGGDSAGTKQVVQEPAMQIVVESDRSGQENRQEDTGAQAAIDRNQATDVRIQSDKILLQGSCGTGFTSCSGICVNMSMDTDNCGMCGHACPSGWWCQKGECMSMLHMVTTEPTRPGQVSTAREHL